MRASGPAILQAIGSSLLSVGAFGLTTAANYAMSGMIDWRIAVLFIVGGALGGSAGTRAAMHLSTSRHALVRVCAATIFVVAAYMPYRSGRRLIG